MMSQVIRQETLVFFLAVMHGISLTFLYDVLRVLRRVFHHGSAAVAAEDFLFWVAAAFLTFCLAFLKTDGVIRGYAAVGIALGVVLYHETVSRWIVFGGTAVLVRIRKLVRVTVRFFWRIWYIPCSRFAAAVRKRIVYPAAAKIRAAVQNSSGRAKENRKKKMENRRNSLYSSAKKRMMKVSKGG